MMPIAKIKGGSTGSAALPVEARDRATMRENAMLQVEHLRA
jgi:hypothetical protein